MMTVREAVPGVVARASPEGVHLGKHLEAAMRIRRNILASALLAVGAIGSLAVGPVLVRAAPAAPADSAVAVSMHPGLVTYGA